MDFKWYTSLSLAFLLFSSQLEANTVEIKLPSLNQSKSFNQPAKGQALKIAEPYVSNLKSTALSPVWIESGKHFAYRVVIKGQSNFVNLGFVDLFIPPQGVLTISDQKTGKILGRYDETANKQHGQLWTPSFYSQELLVELKVEKRFQNDARFTLKQINQGFYDGIKSSVSTKAGSCNIDVSCAEGDYWSNESRSVAKYTISTERGSFLCTGQLVNNVEQNYRPFFLTAAHCMISEETAPSMVLYWNFQRTQCGVKDSTAEPVVQSGAVYRASFSGLSSNRDGSDMGLVELDQVPPVEANVYYSGWDRRNLAPRQVTAIHHPSGDEKRISKDFDPSSITDYASDTIDQNANAKYLRISAWDKGTTEPGSSGSGIWNAERLLVGTLSGGRAACVGSTSSDDNNLPDWYGRFSSHWEGNGKINGSLKNWLDPNQRETSQLKGLNHCEPSAVHIGVSGQKANVGDAVSFSAIFTEQSEFEQLAWDIDHDGIIDGYGPRFDYRYDDAFSGNIKLFGINKRGCKTEATRSMVIASSSNQEPPQVSNKIDGLQFVAGESVVIDLSQYFNSNQSLQYSVFNMPAGLNVDKASGTLTGLITEEDAQLSPFRSSIVAELNGVKEKVDIRIDVGNEDSDNFGPELMREPENITLNVGDSLTLDLKDYFSDPDSPSLTYSLSGAPSGFQIDNAVLSGTANAEDLDVGHFFIRILASDGVDTAGTYFELFVRDDSGGDNNNGADDGDDTQGTQRPVDELPIENEVTTSSGSLVYTSLLLLLLRRRSRIRLS